MGIWDDVTVEETSFFTFSKVGEVLEGTVTKLDTKRWKGEDGKPDKIDPQLTLQVGEDEEVVYTAGPTSIKKQLIENPPNVGDHIKITFTEHRPVGGGKKAKLFTYEIVTKAPAAKAPFLAS
jgi:DNA helicase TIP49 (TBP-interacting protein)